MRRVCMGQIQVKKKNKKLLLQILHDTSKSNNVALRHRLSLVDVCIKVLVIPNRTTKLNQNITTSHSSLSLLW